MTRALGVVAILVASVVLPSTALAQGSIAGTLRDQSGAVLPGVTVLATGPSPSEASRSVVSNGKGQYQFVDLAPGQYGVTFKLPGFDTVKREAIDVSDSAAVRVDAEMKVLPIEPTITITGPRPVDDLTPFILLIDALQTTARQQFLNRDVIEAIPFAGGPASQRVFSATYHLDRSYSIEGSVIRVMFRATNSFVDIAVKNAAGTTDRWVGEWGLAGLLLNRGGVTRDSLRPGDRVVVTGYPSRNLDDHRLFVRTISRPRDGWKWHTSGLPGQLGVLLPAAQ